LTTCPNCRCVVSVAMSSRLSVLLLVEISAYRVMPCGQRSCCVTCHNSRRLL
jgi:hypothetical protein